LLEKMTNIMTH